jgi:hypothetical protein
VNQNHATVVPRSLPSIPSRRDVLRGLVGAGLGLSAARLPKVVAAKKKRRKNRKPRRNAFGCVNVGKPCRGDDRLCCSGICEGETPKQGKKDTSRCVAHDASTCQAGQRPQGVCGGTSDVTCKTSTGTTGLCSTTTGNAPYCGEEEYCHACKKDADCRPFCGAAAACVQCAGCPQGGTACASPTPGLCDFPP